MDTLALKNLVQSSHQQIDSFKSIIKSGSEIIERQNSIISAYSSIYIIITILLGLAAIAIPLLTYFFVFRPSQKILDQFDNECNIRFEKYLSEKSKAEKEKAFKWLASGNPELFQHALETLSRFTKFDHEEYQNLYKALVEYDLEGLKRSNLTILLTNSSNIYADKYCEDYIFSLDHNDFDYVNIVTRYFSRKGIEKYIPSIIENLKKLSNPISTFNTVVANIKFASLEQAIVFLNSKVVCDFYENNLAFHSNIQDHFRTNYERMQFGSTLFYQKFAPTNFIKQ